MVTYNTIPSPPKADEETLLQQLKTSMNRKGLAGAAVASFVLAMVALSTSGTSSPALGAFSAKECVCAKSIDISELPFSKALATYTVSEDDTCIEVDDYQGDFVLEVLKAVKCTLVTVTQKGNIYSIKAGFRVPFRLPHKCFNAARAGPRRTRGDQKRRRGRRGPCAPPASVLLLSAGLDATTPNL